MYEIGSKRISIAVICVLLCGCAAETAQHSVDTRPAATGQPASAQRAGEKPATDSASSLAVRIEPFSDFYFLVRAQAAGIVDPDPELQPIVDAWLPVQQEIGAFGGFWRFDLAGLLSTSVEEFRDWFADTPETVPSRAGGTIPIRGPGLAMAAAMEKAWPHFLEQRWPQREQRLQAAVDQLRRDFLPKHQRALGYMLDSLGIDDPELEVPMSLVIDTHPPGASTYRTRTGPVVVLSLADLLGEGRFSDLEETLLHETCHVFDDASRSEQDAFSVLRRILAERGLEKGDRRLHDIPHLVMFVQAENTMRRLYNSDHIAYGDTQRGEIAPLYQREGEAAVVVRRLWGSYLDGKISRQQALTSIADELVGEAEARVESER